MKKYLRNKPKNTWIAKALYLKISLKSNRVNIWGYMYTQVSFDLESWFQ